MFNEANPTGSLPRYSAARNLHRANFYCKAPSATKVSLVGDFNNWDPAATPMNRMPDGAWMVGVELGHGYHQYYFLVDDKPTLDPHASGKSRNQRKEEVSLIAIS